jgi:hypothetical protein
MVYLVCLVVRIGSPTRRSRETRETRETHIVFPQTVRFEGQQGRVRKKYFLCFIAYTVPTRRSAGRGRVCKWLILVGRVGVEPTAR